MNKFLGKQFITVGLLVLLSAYLFFFRLGAMALTDPDETFYAQTAKEMLQKNEWVTPHIYGKPQFEKPILFYWLVELSYKAFGVNEFAARFPSAVFALLGVIGIYLLGASLFNKRVALLAAIMLASCVEYIVLSRACVTDMVLATFMLYGALFFVYGYFQEKRYFYILSSAAFALAALTKGPIAIILPAASVFIFLVLAKDLKALKKMPILWIVAVSIAVAAPWYLLEYKLHGKNFIDAFFGFHNVARFLESEHKTGSQAYYNIPIVLGGFFPWSAFLPYGLWHAFKKAQSAKRKAQNEWKSIAFTLVWFLVIFIFFSISSTKLPTYIFPCFISLALITALFWDDFLSEDVSRPVIRGMRFSFYLLVAAMIFGAAGVLVYIKYDYPVILKGAGLAALFLVFGTLISLAYFLNKKFILVLFSITCAVCIFLLPLSAYVLPKVEHYETSKGISKELIPLMGEGDRLGAESNYLAGLAFYTGKVPVDLDKHHIMVQFLSSPGRAWAVIKEKNHIQLYTLYDAPPYLMKPTYMVYSIGKRAIVTNLIPSDGKYIIKRERTK